MKIISSGLTFSNKDNSDDSKNKKTKRSHSTIDSSSFSQFPSYMRLHLERRSSHSIVTKSSINHKKPELEIAKLNARINPLSNQKDEELCKAYSDNC